MLVPAAIAGVRRWGWRWPAFLAASYLGAEALFWSLKGLIDRPRPPAAFQLDTVASASFPSGHTTIAGAVAAAFLIASIRPSVPIGWPIALMVLAPLALLVGLSRIALGVHWLTDVAGGLLLGVGWTLLCAGVILVRGGAGAGPERQKRDRIPQGFIRPSPGA